MKKSYKYGQKWRRDAPKLCGLISLPWLFKEITKYTMCWSHTPWLREVFDKKYDEWTVFFFLPGFHQKGTGHKIKDEIRTIRLQFQPVLIPSILFCGGSPGFCTSVVTPGLWGEIEAAIEPTSPCHRHGFSPPVYSLRWCCKEFYCFNAIKLSFVLNVLLWASYLFW